MVVRNYVTFEADFPDDGEVCEGMEPTPAGRSIAEAISSGICRPGLPHPAIVTQHSFYGWEFQCDSNWCLLQRPGRWLIIIEDRQSLLGRLVRGRRRAELLRSFLDALRRFLEEDSRFSDCRWFTKDEYDNLLPGGVGE